MWRGLRIGPLMPTIPEGFNAELFGNSWVSHRVRDVGVEGFDAFLCEYDLRAFKHRMRVWRRVEAPARAHLRAEGLAPAGVGTPGVRPAVHYIRPDGNADQHRKGAF